MQQREFAPKNAEDWRKWLQNNQDSNEGVWLIFFKKGSKKYNLSYAEALDEALCFGWIDSTKKPIDAESCKQYFSQRRKTSTWSMVNKAHVERLIKAGRMEKRGLEVVELSKINGTWSLLEAAEKLITPPELEKALNNNLQAKQLWDRLSNSNKRRLLSRIYRLKTPEARVRCVSRIIGALLMQES